MALAHRLLDAEDAVQHALRMARDGSSVPEAAMAVWREGLTPEATASLAISGLIMRVNGALAESRLEAFADGVADDVSGAPVAARGRNQPVGLHHAKAYWERVLDARYWTPEGTKPLSAFTLADVRSLMSRAENQVAGWNKRRAAMRLAERLMTTRKVDFVRQLPTDDKAAIAEALR